MLSLRRELEISGQTIEELKSQCQELTEKLISNACKAVSVEFYQKRLLELAEKNKELGLVQEAYCRLIDEYDQSLALNLVVQQLVWIVIWRVPVAQIKMFPCHHWGLR